MPARERRTGELVLWMTAFVVMGAPFAFLLWTFVNRALTGRFVAREAGLALVGLVGLVAVLTLVARRVTAWHGKPSPPEPGHGA